MGPARVQTGHIRGGARVWHQGRLELICTLINTKPNYFKKVIADETAFDLSVTPDENVVIFL